MNKKEKLALLLQAQDLVRKIWCEEKDKKVEEVFKELSNTMTDIINWIGKTKESTNEKV